MWIRLQCVIEGLGAPLVLVRRLSGRISRTDSGRPAAVLAKINPIDY